MKFELRIHDLKLEIGNFLKRSGKSEGILKKWTGNFQKKSQGKSGKTQGILGQDFACHHEKFLYRPNKVDFVLANETVNKEYY